MCFGWCKWWMVDGWSWTDWILDMDAYLPTWDETERGNESGGWINPSTRR